MDAAMKYELFATGRSMTRRRLTTAFLSANQRRRLAAAPYFEIWLHIEEADERHAALMRAESSPLQSIDT